MLQRDVGHRSADTVSSINRRRPQILTAPICIAQRMTNLKIRLVPPTTIRFISSSPASAPMFALIMKMS